MRRVCAGWLGFWAAFGIADYWLSKRGASLSRAAKWLFRTHTKRGRFAFIAGWAGLSAWLIPHITTNKEQRSHVGQ